MSRTDARGHQRDGRGWLAALTVALLSAVIAALLIPSLWLLTHDARLLRVTSGSMAPTITVGGSVVVFPADLTDVHVGDLVTYRGGDGLITHRAVAVLDTDHGLRVRARGDANEAADPILIDESKLVGVATAPPWWTKALVPLSDARTRTILIGGCLGAAGASMLAPLTLRLRRP